MTEDKDTKALSRLRSIEDNTSSTSVTADEIKVLMAESQKEMMAALREISDRLLAIQEALEERG